MTLTRLALPAALSSPFRFIYFGLSRGDAALSAALFKVHDALTKKAGMGCIVRAISGK